MTSPTDDPGEAERAVVERLERLGERIRDKMLREGTALSGPDTERAVGETLRRLLPARRSPLLRRSAWLAVAVAGAAAALLLFLSRPKEDSGSGTIPLGPNDIRLVRPLGEVKDFDVFEWEAELPPGGSYQLLLRDRARPERPAREIPLERPRWIPDGAERAQLPDELEWEVRMLDALGRVRDSDKADATRESGS